MRIKPMSVISIRLSEDLLCEIDALAHLLHLPRAKYIRKAIENMNEAVLLRERKDQLIQASLQVRKESMKINAEFDEIEHDPKT
jgi:metal-responsive CopG/Arc/MetJ family transcriptional regulator